MEAHMYSTQTLLHKCDCECGRILTTCYHIAPSWAIRSWDCGTGEKTFVLHLARARPLLCPIRVPWFKKIVEKLDMIEQFAPKTISC